MLSGFKQFILRGNVVDMAVGVVIGAAFGNVVAGFTKDLLNPLIALVKNSSNSAALTGLSMKFHGQTFALDDVVNAAISFLLIAAAVYFCVVLPVNYLTKKMHKAEAPADPTTKKCPECLSEIPISAKRCAHCAQPVGALAASS
jgi:large conductance mechanosensitive channel